MQRVPSISAMASQLSASWKGLTTHHNTYICTLHEGIQPLELKHEHTFPGRDSVASLGSTWQQSV